MTSTILSGVAATLAVGPAAAQVDSITVTATKTEETAQDVAIALQAVDAQDIEQLDIENFEDYVRYLPNVTAAGRGPGQNTPYIRGMAIQPITVLLSGAQGTTPNVAVYLDEQPVTAPGRNLDVYITDIERIEVLKGPQGTLFGASSQAGTIRYITNKPDPAAFAAGFDASFGFTEDGEMSTGAEGYINVPIIDDKLAVRAAVYSVQYGGYIDNVPGTFELDRDLINANSGFNALPADTIFREDATNATLVEEDFNDSSYEGFRVSGMWFINQDWDLLVQHTMQTLNSEGVFDYDPDVGDLDVNRFFPDSLEDEFNQTSWTLQGRLAMLDLLYTGAYLSREINQSVDYTGYNNSGAFIPYYTCTYDSPRVCLDPAKGAIIFQEHERNTHEFRVNTPEENRWRVTAGFFYDDFQIATQDDYYYLATPELGFFPSQPIPGAYANNPQTREPGVAFFNDILRTEEQYAFFGEVSFDVIPDTLTVTGGARWYNIESDFTGQSKFADGPFQAGPTSRGRDYDISGGHTPEPLEQEDTIFKANVAWTPTPEVLFYATWSEGFRPGGFNRGGGLPSTNPAFPTVQTTYDTDDVVNWELGWKTLLGGGNVQFNGSAYFIEWTDMQVSRFDPTNVSILTFIENAADAEIRGVEADVVWTPTTELTLFGAMSWNDAELTSVDALVIELAPVGSQLPLVPTYQATARARYDTMVGEYNVYGQFGLQYAGESFSSLVADVREKQESYTTLDLSIGAGRDGWDFGIFFENLTDTRAELFINEQDDIPRVTTNRPRTVTFRLSYDY